MPSHFTPDSLQSLFLKNNFKMKNPNKLDLTNKIVFFISLLLFGSYCQNRNLNGRLYANYEPCPFPKVQITNSTDPFDVNTKKTQQDKSQQVNGNFILEIPLGKGNITIEAECKSKNPGSEEKMLKSNYLLELAKIEWDGANELLLFNDVDLLAFGYPEEPIGIA